jgi:hypothetical protein
MKMLVVMCLGFSVACCSNAQESKTDTGKKPQAKAGEPGHDVKHLLIFRSGSVADGETNSFIFTGRQGMWVYLSTLTNGGGKLTIVAPDGTAVAGLPLWQVGAGWGEPLLLPMSGQYVINVTGTGAPGYYSFQMVELPPRKWYEVQSVQQAAGVALFGFGLLAMCSLCVDWKWPDWRPSTYYRFQTTPFTRAVVGIISLGIMVLGLRMWLAGP